MNKHTDSRQKNTDAKKRRKQMIIHSTIEVLHGEDLDEVVNRAFNNCPSYSDVIDLDVKFLNGELIVISKIKERED